MHVFWGSLVHVVYYTGNVIIFDGRMGRIIMKRMIAVSSLALMVGLTTGCSSEKTSDTKTASVQKEKELVAKDIFNKAADGLKQEENLTLIYDVAMNASSKSEGIKMKIQMEPKLKNSRTEMKMSGTDIVTYEVDGKVVAQVKNPDTGELITVPNDQFNKDDLMMNKNFFEELDLPEALAKKMKTEKDGDKYKLILELKGKEAMDTLQKVNGNMKKLTEGLNMDALNVEYIITKDYKLEAVNSNIKVSANEEHMNLIMNMNVDSIEKFDPIKLPEGI
ncbi:hypothetical protein bcere0026_29320 [Bacillus mycoides]|uniref:Lipoprotein n=2 Tax=Bacillus TaxID=1386 RepID=C2XW56_BACMY|nr:hypothetical protein bcere0026_29320 [Bacillus mycoides]